MFTRAITKFRLSLKQAVYVFNVFMLPTLELALHYVHGAGTNEWLRKCDGLLIGCIKHASGSLLRLSHSAVALSLGLLLPSWLETSIKVSELFLRMNSQDVRWGQLGRLLMRHSLTAVVDSSSALPLANRGTRVSRSARLAVDKLSWSLHLAEQHRANSRLQHLFDTPPVATLSVPDLSLCSDWSRHCLSSGAYMHLAQDVWPGWGTHFDSHEVHAYTDGSYDPSTNTRSLSAESHSTSSWAVTVSDEWLDGSFGSIPSEEHLVRPHHVSGATLLHLSPLTQYPVSLKL